MAFGVGRGGTMPLDAIVLCFAEFSWFSNGCQPYVACFLLRGLCLMIGVLAWHKTCIDPDGRTIGA